MLTQKLLDDHAVAEFGAELAVALVDADDAEAAALVQGEARRVFREDAGDELPEATLGVGPAKRVEGPLPDAW